MKLPDQFEGVIWHFRSGAQWREMPEEFGPWPTVYGRSRVWHQHTLHPVGRTLRRSSVPDMIMMLRVRR